MAASPPAWHHRPVTKPTRKKVANDLSESEFLSWYGRWQPLSLPDMARLLDGSGVRWWIAGGLAIEAAGGAPREHSDVDLAIAADDLARFQAHLPDLQLWEAHLGSLTPLLPGNTLTPGREQLWARRDAGQPWLLDLLLSHLDGGELLFKHDHSIRIPMSSGIVHRDGIPYLAPQVVLLHKARLMRDKDRQDFDTTVDLLDRPARAWLTAALDAHLPGHEWLQRLS